MNVAEGSTVWTLDRRSLTLAALVKSGGAGSVYLLRESNLLVAKIYHDNAELAQYQRKVAAMLELSPKLPDLVENGQRYVQIAWPQSSLHDQRGRFIGFVMPAVDIKATSELEYMLQERQARAAGLPEGLGAKVTLAANLAAVVAELHRQHHHVVDLKPVNLRFYRHSLYMAMLDCDGFSIQGQGERFGAEQYTPDYLAPELQGHGVSPAQEEAQDCFALAVVVFQLLNFGIHPFSGRPASDRVPTDVPSRIAGRFYAYGLRPNPAMAPNPVSGHAAFPADLRNLFDRAFAQHPSARPSAMEWSLLLKSYAQRSSNRLVACSQNAVHQHFAGSTCAACARDGLIQRAQRATDARQEAARGVLSRVLGRKHPARPAVLAKPTPAKSPLARWPTRRLPRHRIPRRPPLAWPTTPAPQPVSKFHPRTLIAIGIYVVMFVVSMLNPSHHRASSSTTTTTTGSPTPSTTPAPYTPPTTWYSVGGGLAECYRIAHVNDFENLLEVAASGAAFGEPQTVDLALKSIWRETPSAPGIAPDLPESMRASFQNYVDRGAPDDALHDGLVNNLQQRMQMASSPEAAYELGWLALQTGDRELARQTFVCSLSLDPGNAASWYGMGVAVYDEQWPAGYLAIAHLLSPGGRVDAKTQEQFRSALHRFSDRDPEHMAELDRNARSLYDRLSANDKVDIQRPPSAATGDAKDH
jgi:hypothetical protein